MQNYTVVKKLGTGTYGSAYLVSLRVNPSQQFVLKKVKIDGSDSSADSEVKVLRSLSHPLVLRWAYLVIVACSTLFLLQGSAFNIVQFIIHARVPTDTCRILIGVPPLQLRGPLHV